MAEVLEAGLQVQWQRIVHTAATLRFRNSAIRRALGADHVLVIDVPAAENCWWARVRVPGRRLPIAGYSAGRALLRPGFEVLELDCQQGGLDCINAEVAADAVVIVCMAAAVNAQFAQDFVQSGVIGQDRAGVA